MAGGDGRLRQTARRLASMTDDEREFIAEMEREPGKGWVNFDPPFLRRYVARLERWGWLETRDEGRWAEHRWTDAGRTALAADREGREDG